ncbi:MAG: hypothetical protein RR614_08855 [Eubacterium sp.]
MKKTVLISGAIILLTVTVVAIYFFQFNTKQRTAAADLGFDQWMIEHLAASDNYTITLDIPEESTGNRWINLDSMATVPFFSWLDRRLYEGPSTLTIKVSKSTQTASFDDGIDLYFLSLRNDDVYTYFPLGNGHYDAHGLKNPKAAKYIHTILFSKNADLFKSTFPSEDAEISPGHIKLTRKIDSTPFLASFLHGDELPPRNTIRIAMETLDSSEPEVTMSCEFAQLLADISALLYNEDTPKSDTNIGDYHLNITINQFDQTGPVLLPDPSLL